VPAKDLAELVKYLQKEKSQHYTYGSTGPGSFMHVIGEALSKQTGIEMVHVPLKGAAPLKQELIAGRLNIGGDQLSSSLADIKAGKLKALATNASKRIPELPEVPTVRELGFPVLEADGWNGFFAPARTPREVIARLQKEVAAAVRHPETAKRFTEIGAEPVGSSPAEQDAILKRQVDQFRPIIKEMRIEG
jgi:tripartite-type tricarboxylate transporter receptor subunit TctC